MACNLTSGRFPVFNQFRILPDMRGVITACVCHYNGIHGRGVSSQIKGRKKSIAFHEVRLFELLFYAFIVPSVFLFFTQECEFRNNGL